MALIHWSFAAGKAILTVFKRILFLDPLENLYFHGPASLGMWAGKPRHDICARITGVDSSLWKANPDLCDHEIQKHMNSLVVTLQTVVLLVFYFCLLKTALFFMKLYIYMQLQRRLRSGKVQDIHRAPVGHHPQLPSDGSVSETADQGEAAAEPPSALTLMPHLHNSISMMDDIPPDDWGDSE